jgi:hypothetical protein
MHELKGISDIAKGYVKLGHKVSVVTMHYKGLKEKRNL